MSDTANFINASTGYNVDGYNIAVRSDEIRHTFANHGNQETESLRGQVGVTDEILEKLPSVFAEPDEIIKLESKDYAGRSAFELRKRINGYAIVVNGVSDGRKTIFIDSFRVIKKKPPTTSDAISNLKHTPETSNGPASNNSIPQSAEINNQQIPPTQNYTRDSFNRETEEGFEANYKTGMEETAQYGEAANVMSEPEIAKSIVGNGVSKGKDIQRNADAAFRNSPEGRAWFKRTFEDNFYQSKGRYATEMKQKLDELYNNVVKDLGIKKGSKESAAVQWIGEGKRQRFDEKGTPISNETIPYTLENLKEDFNYTMPNGKKAWENIVSAEAVMRRTYDSYVDQINGALRKIYPNVEEEVEKIMTKAPKAPIAVGETIKTQTRGNSGKVMAIDGDRVTVYFVNNQTGKSATVDLPRNEIIPQSVLKAAEDATVGKRLQPRKDYFRHFTEQQKGLMVGLDSIINGATAIDPRLVGLSEFTKPNSMWTAFLQRRGKGDMYTEDAVGGLLEYIPQAEYKINIEPNIPVLRKIIRDLKESTVNTRNANQFIDQLMQITNDLAGKTNQWDRWFSSVDWFEMFGGGEETGRKTLNTLSLISNRMRSNAVVGNFNTVLAQFFNLPNVVGYAKNPVDLASGFKQAIQAHMGSKEAQALLDKSMFLKERYLDRSLRRFDESMLGNTNSFLSWTMEIGDKATAEGAWLTFYKQAMKKNLPEDQAILFADEFTRKSVAGRGIGEMPLSQKAKVTKLFVPFQVEVRNAYNVLKDLGAKKDAAGIIGIFATTFLMNEILEKSTGRRIGFDPADVIRDGISEAQNGQQPGEVAKGIGFGLAGNALTNMPGGSYLAAAGASALDLNEYQMQELFGQNDPSRFGTGNIALQTLGAPLGLVSGYVPERAPKNPLLKSDSYRCISNYAAANHWLIKEFLKSHALRKGLAISRLHPSIFPSIPLTQ